MKNKNLLFNILAFIYVLFAILSVHTINNFYFYLLSFGLAIIFLFKKYIKLSFSIFLTMLSIMPIWLFFNNLFYERFLHYSLLSDIFTSFSISLIFTLINRKKEAKFKFFNLIFPFITILFYPYYAYEIFIYWTSILIIMFLGLNILEKEYTKFCDNKIQITLFIIYFLTFSYYLYDTYKPINSDKIAILKSDWCDVSSKPNLENHQIAYYYSYIDFLKILSSYGNITIIDNSELENNKLDFNTIILITPTNPINNIQVEKLNNFVKNGGRLILITDHTNLYGHIDAVQGLLESFKIRMNDDANFNPSNFYEEAILNTNSIKLNKIIMKTGNSIIPPVLAKIWAITPKVISEKADYTAENFFDELIYTPDDSVGSFPIGITIKKGLGSFIIWNDSTIFSNFSMSQKDNIKLLDYIVKNKVYGNKKRKINYNFVEIYSTNNKIFLEAPPNYMPEENHYSTLIANFTRNNCFPEFLQKETKDSIFFTTYNYLNKNFDKINSSKIVIIDDVPQNNFLNINKYDFENNKMTELNKNYYYSQNGKDITIQYKDKNIMFAKNILSDNELGTWWNITPISPYKKEMIKRFFEWINNDNNIEVYKYPKLEKKNQGYLVKFDNGTLEYWDEIYISKIINFDKNNITYLGNRQWAFVINKNTLFGTPEMSDDFSNTLNTKWVAKIRTEKSQIKNLNQKKQSIKSINKYKKIKKRVAP